MATKGTPRIKDLRPHLVCRCLDAILAHSGPH